ncbi:MAG: histidinol dehydrogenase [Candidatus Jacksonbacteria bacterium]|nr:histidinol dehydrogenase [Candidatus Jacksonbacteria bacterium]
MTSNNLYTVKLIYWDQAEKGEKRKIMERSQADMEAIKADVDAWIDKFRQRGDEALVEYARKFDKPDFTAKELRVTKRDIEEAYANVDSETLAQMREQIRISRAFHEEQAKRIEKTWQIETVPGVITGVKKAPIESVGLYVPAGKSPLPTVAQILTVAAKTAGVPRIAVCFPPTAKNYEIIVAAVESGADEIYRVGGIAAIAALAYGTETIKPVCKIVGPGSRYVQAAKLQVVGRVGIDMLSGPSEALIMADETSNPAYLAADILARAEHGSDSAGIVITTSKRIAEETVGEVRLQARTLARQEYIKRALQRYSAVIILKDEDAMIDFANEYSAEHLEVQTKDPEAVFSRIRNAGSVFLGSYAPVAVGDYASGTNHCLPTGRAVKYSSPIGVETFMKTIQFQRLSRDGLKTLQPIVRAISRVEGLDAHERSVAIRLQK